VRGRPRHVQNDVRCGRKCAAVVAPIAADMHVREEGSEQLDCYVPRTELVLRCALSREDDKQRILMD